MNNPNAAGLSARFDNMEQTRFIRVLLSAGGTAGHVLPALTVLRH